MRKYAVIVASLLAIAVVALGLPAEDMCIPAPIRVTAVAGGVFFEFEAQRDPLSNVTVQVAPYGYKKPPIASVVTKEDGKFSLPGIPKGRYYLSLRHPGVIGLTVEMFVESSKRTNPQLEVVLRNDPSRTCAGATVAVITSKQN